MQKICETQTTITRITTRYSLDNFPDFDNAVIGAVGRSPDHSGAGFGERDMMWDCQSEIEAHKIKSGLRKIGLVAEENQWIKQ